MSADMWEVPQVCVLIQKYDVAEALRYMLAKTRIKDNDNE